MTKSSSIYYVYALIDPRTGPFYIGKGKGERCHHHVREWRSGRLQPRCNVAKLSRIGQIYEDGHEVRVQILVSDLPEQRAYAIEREYIDSLSGLTNCTGAYNTSLEGLLHLATDAVKRFKNPRDWKWGFLQVYGRLPSEADWDQYVKIYVQHVELRNHLRAEFEKANAQEAA